MCGRDAFVLVGPTASGKTDVGQILAERVGGAVLSADSMQIYKEMDIGTAKQPVALRGSVPYLGIDLITANQKFDLWQYLSFVRAQVDALPAGTPLLVVGGSGLYVRALMEGLDAAHADPANRDRWNQILDKEGIEGLQAILAQHDDEALSKLADPQNPRRVIRAIEQVLQGRDVAKRSWSTESASTTIVGIMPDRELTRSRIARRVHTMYEDGLLDEARTLLDQYSALSDTAKQAIGYCEAFGVLSGEKTMAEAKERTVIRTNRLAKRQRTWFRHQATVDWVSAEAGQGIDAIANAVAERWEKHGSIQLKF